MFVSALAYIDLPSSAVSAILTSAVGRVWTKLTTAVHEAAPIPPKGPKRVYVLTLCEYSLGTTAHILQAPTASHRANLTGDATSSTNDQQHAMAQG